MGTFLDPNTGDTDIFIIDLADEEHIQILLSDLPTETVMIQEYYWNEKGDEFLVMQNQANGTSILMSLDIYNGSCTQLYSFGNNSVLGGAINSQIQQFYAVAAIGNDWKASNFLLIDMKSYRVITNVPISDPGVTDIQYDPSSNTLYALINNLKGIDCYLGTINSQNGVVTRIMKIQDSW